MKRLGVTLLLCMAATACSSLAYRTRIDEFKNPALQASTYSVLTVLPVDPEGPDMNIAARARGILRREGVQTIAARVLVGEGEVNMKKLCTPEAPADYQGVVFVAWDRVILRDCATSAVAFMAKGNYSGVDALTKKLVVYLKSGTPRSDNP